MEEQELCSNGKTPFYVYRKKTKEPGCETEYVLYLDAESEVGHVALSRRIDSDLPPLEDIIAATQKTIYFIAPHHTKESVSALLSICGFVDIQTQKHLVSCRKPG